MKKIGKKRRDYAMQVYYILITLIPDNKYRENRDILITIIIMIIIAILLLYLGNYLTVIFSNINWI